MNYSFQYWLKYFSWKVLSFCFTCCHVVLLSLCRLYSAFELCRMCVVWLGWPQWWISLEVVVTRTISLLATKIKTKSWSESLGKMEEAIKFFNIGVKILAKRINAMWDILRGRGNWLNVSSQPNLWGSKRRILSFKRWRLRTHSQYWGPFLPSIDLSGISRPRRALPSETTRFMWHWTARTSWMSPAGGSAEDGRYTSSLKERDPTAEHVEPQAKPTS